MPMPSSLHNRDTCQHDVSWTRRVSCKLPKLKEVCRQRIRGRGGTELRCRCRVLCKEETGVSKALYADVNLLEGRFAREEAAADGGVRNDADAELSAGSENVSRLKGVTSARH